ncbi:MAG: PEP-utilizing enzyme [Candidatus Micrarchaeota archaeon]
MPTGRQEATGFAPHSTVRPGETRISSAREFGKPCVIGTKVATKIFKDGDMVEVDSEKGVVRRIQ